MIAFQLSRPLFGALVGGAVLFAAGCSQPRANLPGAAASAPSLEGLATAPSAASWSTLEAGAALLHLPDGRGQAVSLRERRSAQGNAQEVEWPARDGTGRNLLTIAVHGDATRPGLYPAKPSEAGIKAEIAEAFPSRQLRIVPEPRRNAYGPYGLAVLAGADGLRCVYAWQWLDADDRRVRDALGGSASWRARICRRSQTLDEIAAALDQVTIGVRLPMTSAPRAAAVPAKSVRRQQAKAVADSLHPVAREPAPASIGHGQGGQRYLAAVPAMPPRPAGESVARTALDQTLPAEAYRGPGSRQMPQSGTPVREAAMARRAVLTPD